MRPSFKRFYSADCVVFDPVFGGNYSLQPSILANRSNLFKRQFSCATLFATICSAMFYFIGMIIFWRVPSKITPMIVLWVSIVMTALHAFWSHTYKSLHYQFVRSAKRTFVFFPQTQIWAIRNFINCLFFYFVSFYRSNATKIRNLIDTFKSNNITPFFHDNPRLLSMGIY